jgi:hypothetical protein
MPRLASSSFRSRGLKANHASQEAPRGSCGRQIEQKERRARRGLPDHLRRERVKRAPACSCPDCGATMKRIGVDVTEMLEYTYAPASFKVIRHLGLRLACGRCQKIVQVPAPPGRSRAAWPVRGCSRSHPGCEVRRPLAAVSPFADLRPRGGGARRSPTESVARRRRSIL